MDICHNPYVVVGWGGSTRKRDADRLVRKAGSVADVELESLISVREKKTMSKLLIKYVAYICMYVCLLLLQKAGDDQVDYEVLSASLG